MKIRKNGVKCKWTIFEVKNNIKLVLNLKKKNKKKSM